jgi:hypothetical protein
MAAVFQLVGNRRRVIIATPEELAQKPQIEEKPGFSAVP